jgi:hypothetical protein
MLRLNDFRAQTFLCEYSIPLFGLKCLEAGRCPELKHKAAKTKAEANLLTSLMMQGAVTPRVLPLASLPLLGKILKSHPELLPFLQGFKNPRFLEKCRFGVGRILGY